MMKINRKKRILEERERSEGKIRKIKKSGKSKNPMNKEETIVASH